MDVIALVVTYNRKQLLAECINAINKQSVKVKEIIVIDNASTDGSKDYLFELGLLNNVDYRIMQSNLGGSGGFYEGIRISKGKEFELLWLMDDDTIPERECLQYLIEGYEYAKSENNLNISFIASSVFGSNLEVMNVPGVDLSPEINGYSGWYRHLDNCLIRIKFATFVSLLINKEAIVKCGLPCKDYFIWGDDIEYTLRLTSYYGPAFFSGKSVAIHKRSNAKSLDINNEDNHKRILLYHNYYRNYFINARYYKLHKMAACHSVLSAINKCFRVKGKDKGTKRIQILKGTFEGLTQYSKYKRYIESEINT